MIQIDAVTKIFKARSDRVLAIDNATLEVGQGKFFTLLGPSGCGKTTTMRCIAGLERPDLGRISIGSTTVFDRATRTYVPTAKRPIAMVFQSYAIWPHFNVFENVAYPLRATGVKRSEIQSRVKEALALVDLQDQTDRPAPQLSGGQQQRVALARAIIARPDVLILDEPLSNLDASLRNVMRVELKRLQSTLELTTVYVTHDQQEALSMSDEVAVMRFGKLMQVGTPSEIYHRPAGRFVAQFVGATNLIDAEATDTLISDVGAVDSPLGRVVAAVSDEAKGSRGAVSLSVRPEAVEFGSPDDDHPTATVEEVMFLGESIDYLAVCNGVFLRVRRPSTEPMASVGDRVSIKFSGKGCVIVPPADASDESPDKDLATTSASD